MMIYIYIIDRSIDLPLIDWAQGGKVFSTQLCKFRSSSGSSSDSCLPEVTVLMIQKLKACLDEALVQYRDPRGVSKTS